MLLITYMIVLISPIHSIKMEFEIQAEGLKESKRLEYWGRQRKEDEYSKMAASFGLGTDRRFLVYRQGTYEKI